MTVAADLFGRQMGGFIVVERIGARRGQMFWRARCQCGRVLERSSAQLNEAAKENRSCRTCANKTHGHGFKDPTYRSWQSMKRRCLDPKAERYSAYGGRGIRICDRWIQSFEAFLADMGTRPDGTSIDRVDVNGDYKPGNCRWATRKEQDANRRRPRLRKLTVEAIAAIRESAKRGYTHASIAKAHGISRSHVGLIANGKIHAHR